MPAPMPDKASQKPSNKAPKIQPEDRDSALGEFFHFIGPYASSEGFQRLKTIIQENEELREANSHLRSTNDTNFLDFLQRRDILVAEKKDYEERLASGEAERNRELQEKSVLKKNLNSERNEVEKLTGLINDQKNRILKLEEAVKVGEDEKTKVSSVIREQRKELDRQRQEQTELRKESQIATEQLNTRSNELLVAEESLASFRSFMVNLQPLDDQKKAQVRGDLHSLFNTALEFFQSKLGHDVEQDLLSHSSASNSHAPPLTTLPLPLSNSTAAKQMRVATGLMACSNALTTYIFRPAYLTQNQELDEATRLVAASHPVQETFIRAVLLNTLPEKQEETQDKCIELAVQDIYESVRRWLTGNDIDAFKSEVGHLCRRASSIWMLIQRVQDRIWPESTFHVPEEWQPLPNRPSLAKAGPSPSSNPSSQQNAHRRQQNSPDVTKKLQRLSANEVAAVVWPVFLASDPEELDNAGVGVGAGAGASAAPVDLIHHGYVLTRSQMKDAEEETSHRAARRIRRSDSSTQEKDKRRNSAAFLSFRGDSGGSGIK